jgi:hypothetical protein
MRRILIVAALLAALGAGVTARASAGPDTPLHGRALASVRVVECVRSDRTASFYARAARVTGAERMGMRFTLLEQMGEGPPLEPRRVPGLGRWRKSRPGRRAFGVRQRVRNLVEGSAYRMRVSFRWYDADGQVIKHTRRRSRLCRQFVPRPNLQVELLHTERTDVPGVLRYFVSVSNIGKGAAYDAAVGLVVDGSAAGTKTVHLLRRGETRTVSLRGPVCHGGVEAQADPENLIPESSETDNSDTRACSDLR